MAARQAREEGGRPGHLTAAREPAVLPPGALYLPRMVEDLQTTPPAFAEDGDDDPKRRKKEAKLLAEQARSLDPWERYRTLVDALEEGMDLVELADRKARFALVIMGALNISFFFLVTRAELIDVLPAALRPFLGFYLLIYAGVALFFFLEAIEALKPRRFRPQHAVPRRGWAEHFPEGLRYYEDVVLRDLEAYRRAWREVRFGQLNAELAVQNHVMARINSDKFRSLRRLYGGLRVLTLLAGGLLAVLALSMLASRQPPPVAEAAGTLSRRPHPRPWPPRGTRSGRWSPARPSARPSRWPPRGCSRPPASPGTRGSSASSRWAIAARWPRSTRLET